MRMVICELSSPIKYANGSGAQIECNHIELREPTGKVSAICCALEGMIKSAMVSMGSLLDDDVKEKAQEAAEVKKAVEEPEEIDEGKADAIYEVLISSGVDMQKLVLHYRELFKSVAWMGGEKLITSSRLDDLTHRDMKKLIGQYTANFILN